MENKDAPTTQKVDGKDVQILTAAVYAAFEQIAESLTVERFHEIFGELPLFKNRLSKSKKVFKIFKNGVIRDCESDFKELLDSIATEIDLNSVLSIRSRIIEEQKNKEGTKAWRPSGEPRDDIRAHDMPILKTHFNLLDMLVKDSEQHLSQLINKVTETRAKTTELRETARSLRQELQQHSLLLSETYEKRLNTLDLLLSDSK